MSRSDKFFVISFGVFILTIGILIFLLPQREFSESENRYLARLPSFSAEAVFNGEYARGISDFYTDQVPFRNIATSIYALSERCMGKRTVGGVICDGEQLITISQSEVTKKEAPIPSICVDSKYTLFKNQDYERLSLYYNTDHHRTTYGAYLLYVEACGELGVKPYSKEYFERETVCEDFYGTAFFKSRLPKFAVTPDEIELWRYEGDENVRVTIRDTKAEMRGFYDFSRLDGADKYAVFMGGNYAHASVISSAEKPTLLLFKDSFANAVIPFLSLHFNIEVVDPRYATMAQMRSIYSAENYDYCLFLGCLESFN